MNQQQSKAVFDEYSDVLVTLLIAAKMAEYPGRGIRQAWTVVSKRVQFAAVNAKFNQLVRRIDAYGALLAEHRARKTAIEKVSR